jgi:hypothetical protein
MHALDQLCCCWSPGATRTLAVQADTAAAGGYDVPADDPALLAALMSLGATQRLSLEACVAAARSLEAFSAAGTATSAARQETCAAARDRSKALLAALDKLALAEPPLAAAEGGAGEQWMALQGICWCPVLDRPPDAAMPWPHGTNEQPAFAAPRKVRLVVLVQPCETACCLACCSPQLGSQQHVGPACSRGPPNQLQVHPAHPSPPPPSIVVAYRCALPQTHGWHLLRTDSWMAPQVQPCPSAWAGRSRWSRLRR